MTTTKSERLPRLSNEQLEEMLRLNKGSNSVELKLSVPESDQRQTVRGLGLDPLEAQIRQIFFLDTPELTLNANGLVVRARRIQGKGDDSVVKLRPVVPDDLPADIRKSPNMKIEVDAMPGGFVCSASMKGQPVIDDVRKAVFGDEPLRRLFTKEQRAFYAAHAPEGVELDGLSVLGPIFVLKLNFVPKELGRKLTGEMWLFPDNQRMLELSTTCAPGEAFQVAAEARAFLTGKGVDLEAEQQTKTKTALEFFAKELRTPVAS